jgi:hypothetical protein
MALGRTGDVAEHLRQARDIFQRIGGAEAAYVAAELDTLAGPRQGSPGLEQETGQPYRQNQGMGRPH